MVKTTLLIPLMSPFINRKQQRKLESETQTIINTTDKVLRKVVTGICI